MQNISGFVLYEFLITTKAHFLKLQRKDAANTSIAVYICIASNVQATRKVGFYKQKQILNDHLTAHIYRGERGRSESIKHPHS